MGIWSQIGENLFNFDYFLIFFFFRLCALISGNRPRIPIQWPKMVCFRPQAHTQEIIFFHGPDHSVPKYCFRFWAEMHANFEKLIADSAAQITSKISGLVRGHFYFLCLCYQYFNISTERFLYSLDPHFCFLRVLVTTITELLLIKNSEQFDTLEKFIKLVWMIHYWNSK